MSGYNFNFTLGIALSFVLALALAFARAQAAVEFGPGERKLLTMLDEDDMEVVHAHALEILDKCQLPECMIVSLGTTNTLVDSFLRYYLRDNSDHAIHYVPIRKLSSALAAPTVIERSLPKPSQHLKRVLLVRTLELGLSITRFANAIDQHFATTGVPYDFEGYFSVSDQNEGLIKRLDFPWPYELKELSTVAVWRSYREIDEEYYRYRPITFDYFDFWRGHMTDPKVVEFREQVERSLGVNASHGPKLFEMTEEVKNAWALINASGSYTLDETFLLLPYFLPFDSEVTRLYKAELNKIEDAIFDQTPYQDNSNYKVLDEAVRLFLEDRRAFTSKTCAALAASP